ncbi:dynein axonemal intermediate chain 3 isoform X1 [Astyanax mexicanus]|uniref:dynein axonemal intermediate chain 3 isoform X1 n=1 Tax=Astyanax mexicanus TaxID=7994 RepID=UPI0020CB303E|nr:dynein axonemal intermediate chain 3 isoform X1 [Astyanax mexicanus]
MSAKKPRSNVNKQKDKKNEVLSAEESSAETGHPDHIFPLVLTSATQELFGCRADEDVTGDDPYRLLKKEDIIQDMKTRAAISDFSPIKQAILDYPEDEILLVFDRDFTYGQSFYLVLTVDAKESMLRSPAEVDGEEEEEGESEDLSEIMVQKTPEPQAWVSLGSEREIEDESLMDTRPKLCYKVSRLRRETGAPLHFSDYSTECVECSPYQDSSFSTRRMERASGVQAVPVTSSSSSQTVWKHKRNMWTQYQPRVLDEEEKENILLSKNLKNFLNSVTLRVEVAIQQNIIMNMFVDDWRDLAEEVPVLGGKANTQLKKYQSFTDLNHSKNKTISYINWHPAVSGVIAVAVRERLSYEERIDSSTKLLLNPALILFWSFSDPINPQLMLECPDDVFCFEFCPSDPNIIAGGCMNGQVVLWDISAHMERLQGARAGVGGKNNLHGNTLLFEDEVTDTPVVRYCAVSGIENGHKAPVTDIQWLPDTFEVSRTGIPLENKNQTSVQIVTCAPDCCVMFWDLRAPRVVSQSQIDRKQKTEEKILDNPHGVPNTFKHLDLTWKPLIRVTLPKVDGRGEYSPMKLSLRESLFNSPSEKFLAGEERPEVLQYSQLSVPSPKNSQQLEDISSKFYVGTEDGEIVYTDWKLEKDNESGRLFSPKPTHCFRVHDGLVNTVLRSPFFKDIILSVGLWNFAIWKEGVTNGPILQSPYSQKNCTLGFWSLTRPAVFFIGKEDGNLEIWDLLEKTHEPSQTHTITTAPITCIKPWVISVKQQLLAVSDHLGTLHILEVPRRLLHPSSKEKLNVSMYFEKEVERLIYFEKRQEMRAKEKREMDAEEQRRKMEIGAVSMKSVKEAEQDELKEWEEYRKLENLLLKNMGLLTESHDPVES